MIAIQMYIYYGKSQQNLKFDFSFLLNSNCDFVFLQN
jgi:hypothetical protein